MATGQYIGVNGVARKVTNPYIGVEGVARNVTSGYMGVNGVARLFFAPESGNVVLEVEKITSNTYANETAYENEEFILLDIYPKTGGTVKVTYGGLTKTITDTSGAEEPNAQQVFFGTFNGVSDTVETPASGELIIDGDYYAVGGSLYANASKSTNTVYYAGIKNIKSFGCVTSIPANAFGYISSLGSVPSGRLTQSNIILPNTVTKIGSFAFAGSDLNKIVIPSSVTHIGDNPFAKGSINTNGVTEIVCENNNSYQKSGYCIIETSTGRVVFGDGYIDIPTNAKSIGAYAFCACRGITNHINIPHGITSIGKMAFYSCKGISGITIPSSVATIGSMAFDALGDNATVQLLSTTPPSTESFVFRGSYAIIVPKGCGAVYKAADGWGDYTDRIVEAT